MERVKEYLAQAEMCRSLANQATDPKRKEELMELAANWASLAEEREKLLASRQLLTKRS